MFVNFIFRSIDYYKYGIDNKQKHFYDYKSNSLPIIKNLNIWKDFKTKRPFIIISPRETHYQ